MNRRAMAVIALVAAFALLTPTSTLAAGSYATTSIGHDVSWPNCGSTTLPAAGDFGIVGVTAGRAFSQNSCLGPEYAWAALSPSHASLYMNLNAPVGSTAQGNTSAPRACSKKDKLCQSYDYGWNSANAAYGYAYNTLSGNVATTWWLDVETSNSWLSNLAANAQVVQGALDFLGTGNAAYKLIGKGLSVGVYSTKSMWSTITGGYRTVPSVPVWYATAVTTQGTASLYCASAYAFTGGPVWLVQFTDGSGIDADYAC